MPITPLSPEVVKNKVVVMRVDYNVPLRDGKVAENSRILETIPTLRYLLDNGAKQIHLLCHVGRPKGQKKPELSAQQLIPEIEKCLKEKVAFQPTFSQGEGKIQLHENVRFYEGETKNDPDFIKKLLGIKADLFINDAFAVSHRGHASVVGLATFLPSYVGLGLQKEIETLSPFLVRDKIEGLTVVIGGVKIETKINVLKHFCSVASNVLIGGALANTFLAAQGYDVGKSFYEEDFLDTAREILDIAEKHQTGFHLPVDVMVGETMDSTETLDVPIEDMLGNMSAFDIGPHTVKSFAEIIGHSSSIIWNGPMGCFEKKPFKAGTRDVLKAIALCSKATTILGGGDTLKALQKFDVPKSKFTHVSTGGGAMLEFLEGKDLPGIEALMTSDMHG